MRTNVLPLCRCASLFPDLQTFPTLYPLASPPLASDCLLPRDLQVSVAAARHRKELALVVSMNLKRNATIYLGTALRRWRAKVEAANGAAGQLRRLVAQAVRA